VFDTQIALKSPDFLAAGCEHEMKLSNALFKHPNGENAKCPKTNVKSTGNNF